MTAEQKAKAAFVRKNLKPLLQDTDGKIRKMSDTSYSMTCPVCGCKQEEVDHHEDRAVIGPNLTEEVTDSYYFLCPGCGSAVRVRRKKQ